MSDKEHHVNESADKIVIDERLQQDKPWKDAALVNHLYHQEEMSGPEIADKLGCSITPIYDRIENTRSISEANRIWTWKLPLKVRTSSDGYEVFKTKVHGEPKRFAHHRLMAVAEYGLNALDGKVVHHKNGISWDNRPENLELMDQPNHVREHLEEIARHEKAAIFALVEESNYRTTEIANMFETKKSTVTTVAKRIRDGDYPITGAKA
jgi:predicted DNA-binding protein YlxM (UPF0122 family)